MDLNTLISQYGYAALVIGSLAEGETVTLLGGVAAHQGLLKFPLVVLSVALGGMIGDQVLYLCGRRFGGKLLRRFSKHQDKIERAQKLIQRHPYLFVIGTRFMYGFRVDWPDADWCQPAAAENLSAAEYSRRICLVADFYHYRLRWWAGDCAVVAQSRPAFEALGLVDSGRGSGGRRALVAETAREEKAGSSGVKLLPWIRCSRRIRHPVHHA